MKNTFRFLLLFVGLLIGAQQTTTKDPLQNIDKKAYYKPGEQKLQKDFDRALSFAVSGNYVVNGVLTFAIHIDDTGLAKIIDVKPKVKNHQLLVKDLNYVLRKSHKNWEPAEKNNQKVSSIFFYEIKFNTEVYDHD